MAEYFHRLSAEQFLLGGRPKQPDTGRVGHDDTLVEKDQDGIGRRFDDRAVTRFAFLQRQFGLLAGGDIQ